jgi:hypothetical protein
MNKRRRVMIKRRKNGATHVYLPTVAGVVGD